MGAKPKLFIKNYLDLDNPNVTITPSDDEATSNGLSSVSLLRNRNNISGWGTTGSSDTATTELDVNWIDLREVESIILVGHNFKSYTIQKWNGSSFVDFATPINVTNSTDFVTEHQISNQNISRIKITITSTQVVDSDKFMRQLIVTRKLGAGQFLGWPNIRKFQNNQNRKAQNTLSGKAHVRSGLGGFVYELDFKVWPYDSDFNMIEELFFRNYSGALFWPSGGDETQFRYSRVGYRNEDIVLVKPIGEFDPVWEKGIYSNGLNFTLKLTEVI